jgi:hypothetical protein
MQIAVRTEGVADSEIGAHGLGLCGICLPESGHVQEAIESVTDLHSGQINIEICLWKAEGIQRVVQRQGEVWIPAILRE